MHSKQSYRPDIPQRQGLKVYFGVVLGCKGGEGKKTNKVPVPILFFRCRQSMPGFAHLFWRGIRLQRGRGGKKYLGLEKFFRAHAFQTEL